MRRKTLAASVAILAVSAMGLAACSSGGDSGGGEPIASAAPAKLSGSIEFWHFFSDREAAAIQSVVDDFVKANPGVTVNVKSGQDDQKMRQAISAGQPIDVGLSYSTDQLPVLCTSGDFQNLNSYIKRDAVDMTKIPQTVRDYTAYQGNQCSMPALADIYGLYYNTDMLAAAGYSAPPKTLDELTDMAVKMTSFNDDGSIKTLGFMPNMGYYENSPAHWAPAADAQWFDAEGKSSLASSPGWEELMTWQTDLINKLGGYQKLADFDAAKGEEFSAGNDFQVGRTAMAIDGEYRTAFLADQTPDIKYATAPFPTASDHTDQYGGGYITGNVIGMGKGATNPELAWAFIKYFTTNTDAQVKLANGIKNVPTWEPALTDSKLDVTPQFKTFLDIFESGKLQTTPASVTGSEYQTIFGDFWQTVQSGKVTDVQQGLKDTDKAIDDATDLAGGVG